MFRLPTNTQRRKYPIGNIILISLAAGLCSCTTPPASYNTSGSKGQLIRQEVGFDSNVCHYNNGMTVRTQGNCPPSVTSNVYVR